MSAIGLGTGPDLGELPGTRNFAGFVSDLDSAIDSFAKANPKYQSIPSRLKDVLNSIKNDDADLMDGLKLLTKVEAHIKTNPNDELQRIVNSLRQAYSLSRYQAQTKEISDDDQINFGRLLNSRIDPISASGERLKDAERNDLFDSHPETLVQYMPKIMKVIELAGFSRFTQKLKQLVKDSKVAEAADWFALHIAGIFSHNAISEDPTVLKQASEVQVMGAVSGGAENAINLHGAFVKVAYEKLKTMTDEGSAQFKANWNNLLENLSHISKQFSVVHAMTLKLVENLNGVLSNQLEPYTFNPDNFELKVDNGKLLLLPTVDFLGKVIQLANDPETTVESAGFDDGSPHKFKKFSEQYSKVAGCPIHGARQAQDYFAKLDALTRDIFGLSA